MVQETGIFDGIGCGDGGEEGEVEDMLEGYAIEDIRVRVWRLASYSKIRMQIHAWCLVFGLKVVMIKWL